VFLTLDAGRGVTEQDSKIAGYSHEEGKPIVVVVNKWDLIESRIAVSSESTDDASEEENTPRLKSRDARQSSRLTPRDRPAQHDFLRAVRDELIFLDYSPVVFVSALKKTGLDAMLTTGLTSLENSQKRITTGELNNWLNRLLAYQPPPSSKGKQVKFYYASQVSVSPPSFAIFVNDPELVHFSYLRNLENRLRETFGFQGTPLRLWLRKRQRKASGEGG
jgi:GTPase